MHNKGPPDVHESNGTYMIFKPEHAFQLRQKRIVAQALNSGLHRGGSLIATAGPYHLSPYAVYVIATNQLAKFKRLELRNDIDLEANKIHQDKLVAQSKEAAREIFTERRMAELKRRNLDTTNPTYFKGFDESKISTQLHLMPREPRSNYRSIDLDTSDIITQITDLHDAKVYIYNDLYKRGFFISSGMKFGADFLVYYGDPVGYHAKYAVRLVESDQNGCVDLGLIDFNEINSFQRLTHTANKIPLFTTIKTIHNNEHQIKYWTILERVYLTPDSTNVDLNLVEPIADKNSIKRVRR